jgi:autotransporter-associated beta strand protein
LDGSGSGGITISNVIANGGAIGTTALIVNMSGTGVVTLSSNNTLTGGIALNQGTLVTTAAGGLGANNTLKFGGGNLELRQVAGVAAGTTFNGRIDMTTHGTTVTVNRTDNSAVVTTHSIGGATTLGGGQTMVMSSGANIAADTAYGLTLIGDKTLTGNSTYTINGNGSGNGTLRLITGTIDTGGVTRTLTFNTGTGSGVRSAEIAGAFTGSAGTLVLAGSAPVTIGNLTGGTAHALQINSTTGGVYTPTGQSTYTGGLTLTNGTLNINVNGGSGANGPLGNLGIFAINGGTIDNTSGSAKGLINLYPITVGGDFAFSTDVGTVLNNLLLPGTVDLGGATRTITAKGTGVLTLSGIISNGGLTKAGIGTLVLSNIAGNTYSGTTTINAGTLRAGAAAGGQAFGNGSSVTLADTAGATLNLNNFSQTIGSLAGGGTTGGDVTLGANATLTTGGNDTSTSYAGIISGTGTSGLTKTGNGTLTLNGTNTYSGATAIDAGTLLINGSTSTSLVTVGVNGTLGGTGTVGGNTTISGTHSPGNSPGIQTFTGNLSYVDAGTPDPSVSWELASNTTTVGVNPTAAFDQIIVGGNLDFTDTTTINLSFNGAGSTVLWANALWDADQSWLLYDVAGTTSNFVKLNLATINWLDSGGNLFSTTGGSFTLGQSGQDVLLNYTAIPEPRAALLGGLGLLALLRRRR